MKQIELKPCPSSREKQIEEMSTLIYDNRPIKDIWNEEADSIAETLYNAGYRKQEWISVDERLPEENGRYLAFVDISHLAFENLTTIAIMAYGKSHGFYLYNETEKVTHWMPLPEAPKMKGGAE